MSILDPSAAKVLYALSKAEGQSSILGRQDLVEICGHNLRAYRRAAQTLIRMGLVEDATEYAVPPAANSVFEHLRLTQKGRTYCIEHCIGKS
jgi:DNA-binding IclR family transcriptional regulator